MESGLLNVFAACLACYFIGSVPFAYLVVKYGHNKDLTSEGSGNVGTLNTITVTKSKTIGIIVLLFDLIKGALPVFIMLFILGTEYWIVMAAASCLVLGHNFPVWLAFKGGRGLATGAGIFIILNYYILIAWLICWLVAFAVKRDVLLSNVAATVLIPLYIFIVNKYSIFVVDWNLDSFSIFYFSLFSVVITILIIYRHSEIFKKNKS